jgi:hypothetical protein
MAEAKSAHTTIAPAPSLCASVTYHDLNRPDGSIDRSVLMTLAIRQARQERAECQRLGYDQPWRKCLSEALKRIWEVAKQQRAVIVAARAPFVAPDHEAVLRQELERLSYREDYRAAEMRRRDIEAELGRHVPAY